jgi:hypothetical protein
MKCGKQGMSLKHEIGNIKIVYQIRISVFKFFNGFRSKMIGNYVKNVYYKASENVISIGKKTQDNDHLCTAKV